MDKLKRYIDIHIPVSTCNLKCHYCYVSKVNKYGSEKLEFPYSADHIRRALSKQRLNGTCLFTICGMGETLIPHETIDIIKALLDEGHYITIVTNGLLTKRFDELMNLSKEQLSRVLFKFSLHWIELKRLDMTAVFAANVHRMKRSGASITLELTANDETEPYINEIIEYTEQEFGARCHISIPRDESSTEFLLQSSHTIEEFYHIWNVFDSELLDFKYSIWGKKRKEYCYAGEWSGLLNVQNGEWRSCYHSHFSENIFENIEKPIPFVPVGTHCAIPHCFNGHSWLTLGDIPAINSHSYADVRDRECMDGSHWLNERYRDFISQRLEASNNYPHSLRERILFCKKKAACYTKKGVKKIIGGNKFIKKCFRYGWENICKILYRIQYKKIKNKITIASIESIEDTIDAIVQNKKSASRFGDGEFKWMIGIPQLSFEQQSEELSKRLIEVAQSHEENHIVCISPALANLDYNAKKAAAYWEEMLGRFGNQLMKYLDPQRTYYNANITRFYLNDVNRERVLSRFERLRMVWDNRNILIVEGEYSRLGVGNDLFDNASTIRRIIAPSKNAFSKYHDIFECTKHWYEEEDCILIALGPTATILAFDLARENMQAVDIGHIDIEYEWFLHGYNSKAAIPGKAVNEAIDDRSTEKIEAHTWKKYCSEIVDRICGE